VVVVAGTAVAVAVATHHGHSGHGPASSPGKPGTSASASPGRSHSSGPATPAPTGSVLAVNPANPCTWLTPADFASVGVTTGPLKAYALPGNWLGCHNGEVIVGRRAPGPSVGCSILPNCTNISVRGATGGRYLVFPGRGIEVDAYRGGIEYAVAVPSGTANARSALLRLIELVLTRITASHR